jgi:histidinol-phosphate aminotransferase
MYQVAADTNGVNFIKVSLNSDFSLNVSALKNAISETVKLIIICSPNNPTSNCFYSEDILDLAKGFNGLLVVDEAYIDFAPNKSLISELPNYPNMVILQTFSKAWGLAGIRLGVAYASKEIISVLNKIKYPYNVNVLTQNVALKALDKVHEKENWVKNILFQKSVMEEKLKAFDIVEHIYPSDANFLLVKFKFNNELFKYLIDSQIVTRDRSKVSLCEGCIRITIGNESENRILIEAISDFESDIDLNKN